jgi:tetratricopeptide (TPR) repeat protein
VQRPNIGNLDGGGLNGRSPVHMPGGGGIGIGDRPQIGDGGITRPDLRPGGGIGTPGAGFGPGAGTVRPGAAGGGIQDRFPNAGGGAASLPGLGPGTRPGAGTLPSNRPGAGGAGVQNPIAGGVRPGAGGGGVQNSIAGAGSRPGAGGAGTRFTPDSHPARQNNINNQFDSLKQNWGDGDWHSWTGPNGGQINHIGFWGPNGYWGHTGAWGPNGGHWGHSTGIGPNGAYGRTTGWGPNGNVWGHGAAIGPNGSVGWAGAAGPAGYWSRSWGGWYNGYGPAWGNGRWDYLWNQYPVAMAFGATMWGLNAVAYGMGISDYYNPYYDTGYAYAYDQPITGDPSYEASAEAAAADPASDPLTQTFNAARAAFAQDQFDEALRLTDEAMKQAPRDAALNEFRSLCLFAVGRYKESAAVIHAVLAAGPGWDWTTMIGLYSSPNVYTDQLRKLEAAANADTRSSETRFLLGYHYLTADHADAAVNVWRQVLEINPQDKLTADLVAMYSPKGDVPPATTVAAPGDLEQPAYPLEKLEGDWKATQGDGQFAMHLDTDSFTWSFTQGGAPQTMAGAYSVRGNNMVMQPDSGGTMIGTITLENDNTLVFAPVGQNQKLTFTR